jgi:hypothetical protein
VSNVVNSNSAGSNCSQKTPTTLSQQLALVGICAKCGAHQLASAPTTASTSTNAGGAFNAGTTIPGLSRHGNGARGAITSGSARQMSEQNQRWHKPAGGLACQRQSDMQGSSQLGATTSTAAKILHQKITAPSGLQHQQLASELGAANPRSQFRRSPSDELIFARRNTDDQQHDHSSGMHNKKQHQQQQHQQQQQQQRQQQSGLFGSGHLSDLHNAQRRRSSQTNGRQHVGSLSRLNEMTSFTSSGDRQCIEESISSLVNDSFMNTSLENTPCNASHGAGLRSSTGHADINCKGSDSMLCNQSMHSIDYCSDCCPSICQCSCQVCVSSQDGYENGGASMCSHRRNSTSLIGFDGSTQGNYDAMCIVQLVQRNGAHPGEGYDDGTALINDELMSAQGGHLADTSETSGSTLIRCRKLSVESNGGSAGGGASVQMSPSSRPFALGGGSGPSGKEDKVGPKMVSSKSGIELGDSINWHSERESQYDFRPSAAAAPEGSSRMEDGGGRTHSKAARRSQTMELRTIVVGEDGNDSRAGYQSQHGDKSRQDYRSIGQAHSSNCSSGDSADSGNQREPSAGLTTGKISGKKSSKAAQPAAAHTTTGCGQSVAYALQAAAKSALGAAAAPQIVAVKSGAQFSDRNNDQTPEASTSSSFGAGAGIRGASSVQSKYGVSSKSKPDDGSKMMGASAVLITQKGGSQQQQSGEVDNSAVSGAQRQQPQQFQSCGSNQVLGTIQASLEHVKSIEARRKSMEASAASKHRRKSGCFNYHDEYEYSYGLVQSSDSDAESGGIEDYYYDDDDDGDGDGDDDDNDDDYGPGNGDDDGARGCYYGEETYLRLGGHHGPAATRKGAVGGTGDAATVAGQSAKVSMLTTAAAAAAAAATGIATTAATTTTCDHKHQANEPIAGSSVRGHVHDDKSGTFGDEDDDFEHDGRVSLDRTNLNRARQRQQQQRQQTSRARASKEDDRSIGAGIGGNTIAPNKRSEKRHRHHQCRSSTKRRHQSKRRLEPDEHRINSAALITATLAAGGAIVESGGAGLESNRAQQQQQQQQQPEIGAGNVARTTVATGSQHAAPGVQAARPETRESMSGDKSGRVPSEQDSNRDISKVQTTTNNNNNDKNQSRQTKGESSSATATYLGSF